VDELRHTMDAPRPAEPAQPDTAGADPKSPHP
jgi:hypothetical protein